MIDRDRWCSIIDNKSVGERIAYLRVNRNYTRESFAKLVGISSKFLYEIEAGRTGFSANTLLNIASTLGVSCDYIMMAGVSFQEAVPVNPYIGRGIMESFNEGQVRKIEDIIQLISEITHSMYPTDKDIAVK